jgi:hypothetical protein
MMDYQLDGIQAAARPGRQPGAPLVDLRSSGGLMAFERACVQVGDESAQLVGAGGVAETADQPQPRGNGVRCVSDGCSVFASVEKTVQLPLPLFGDTVVVRGTSYAGPVVGASTATTAHCARGAWLSAVPSSIP